VGAGQVLALVAVGLAAAFGAAYVVTGGHLFDGCSIHLESEATRGVAWRVDYRGKEGVATGTLHPGTKADAKLCTFSPRGQPEGTLRVEGLGNVTFRLDPYCDEWRFLVNDTALVAGSRACA
jgi:hypothetical protein